jgi:hypothetical protein
MRDRHRRHLTTIDNMTNEAPAIPTIAPVTEWPTCVGVDTSECVDSRPVVAASSIDTCRGDPKRKTP